MAPKNWTGLIPLKPAGLRKTRLETRLSAAARDQLAEKLCAHVVEILQATPGISEIVLLAAEPLPGWKHCWIADTGRGLNAELSAAQTALAAENLLVIHADLPFVTCADIAALIAGPGIALAPDRHRAGTNAIALPGSGPFPFTFGQESFMRHATVAGPKAHIIEHPGLGLDVDTEEDLELAIRMGFEI